MNKLTEINTLLENARIPNSKSATFFKTGIGQYAEHDTFMGITVPDLRKISKSFLDITFAELSILLNTNVNEKRFLALIILVQQYEKATSQQQEQIYQFYINNRQHVNNWNLVDASAHLIVGAYLVDHNRDILIDLSASQNLWDRRIAIVSTWCFIRKNDTAWTFKLAALLMNDQQDLMHKAVGWMLREAGKRNQEALKAFLDRNIHIMPRTMLRYSIEKFPEKTRKEYLNRK
jgi:3-methyladenine DNA glycosylase AlkD